MSNVLTLPFGVKGFEVAQGRSISPTQFRYGEVPPPPPPPAPKKPTPPTPPPPDPETIRRQILADEIPRIQKDAEERVRREEAAKHQQQLAAALEAEQARHRQGLAAEMQKRDELLGRLHGEFGGFIANMKAEIASQVAARSLEIAEIILRHELPDRDMLVRILEQTLDGISDLQGAKIKVNPDDLALLRGGGGKAIPFDGQFEWVPDTSLQPGDLMIESRNGIFDASLKQRLELLREQLHQNVGKLHGTVNPSES